MKNTLLGFHIFGVSRQCLGRYVCCCKGCSIVYTPIRAGVDAIFSPIIALLLMVL